MQDLHTNNFDVQKSEHKTEKNEQTKRESNRENRAENVYEKQSRWGEDKEGATKMTLY